RLRGAVRQRRGPSRIARLRRRGHGGADAAARARHRCGAGRGPMRRQIIRYVAMALCAGLLIVVFIQMGQWQLRRLDERRERNAVIVAHESLPVQPYSDVMNRPITDGDQWYRVTATGTYEPDGFQVRYRSLDGAYGSEIAG